jgi:plasmid maintenance system antidote protein VapI
MTPAELDDCLETVRWPASTLATALGRKESEVLAWIAGAKPIPAKTAAWVKTLADAHQALEMARPKARR